MVMPAHMGRFDHARHFTICDRVCTQTPPAANAHVRPQKALPKESKAGYTLPPF